MNPSNGFEINNLKSIDFQKADIIDVSKNRKYGRRFKLKLGDDSLSKDYALSDIFKRVEKLSNKKMTLAEKNADLNSLKIFLGKLKDADALAEDAYGKRDRSYRFRTWFRRIFNFGAHSDRIDALIARIQREIDKNQLLVVAEVLDQEDINVNYQDENGNTALMLAVSIGNVEIVKLLLQHKDIDVNHHNNAGTTALILAVCNGNVELVKLLLEHKNIDVNHQKETGDTALLFAVSNGNVEIVKLLLQHKDIDVNIQNNFMNTALINAAVNKSKGLVELLLQNENIKLNLQDKLGRTAKMYASASGDKEIVEMLSKALSKQDLNLQKEMSKLILLAHSTSRGGTSQLITKETDTKYDPVHLEGIMYTYLLKKMGQAIEHFSIHCPLKSVNPTESLQLSDIFKCSINNSNEEILDRIKKGLPVLLPTGYSRHGVSVLTWGPYFILCNRGEGMREGVVEVFKCDPEKIDSEVLDKIGNSLNKDAESYRKLFFEELPVKLNFKPKGSPELKLQNICKGNLKVQSVGNCSWASPEGSIFTFFLFSTFLADANGQLSRDSIYTMELIEPHRQIRHKFNEWLVVTQMYELERYLGVDVLRTLSPEKASRNVERRQGIEIDYSVLTSTLQTILSNTRKVPDSDDMIVNLKSILAKTLALTTSGDEEQHQKTAQEILDSLETLTSDELKAKFEN